MNEKGFVLTLAALLLVSFLLVYVQFYAGHLRKTEMDVGRDSAHAKVLARARAHLLS